MSILLDLLLEADKWYDNHYFRLTEPRLVHVMIGWEPTNNYYGSSKVHRAKYAPLRLKKGNEIHWLAGGIFAVQKGKEGLMMSLEKPEEKNPFEKNYGGDPRQYSFSDYLKLVKDGKLEEITKEDATKTKYKTSWDK